MEYTHRKCGRKVEVSIFRGGECKKCHKRFWPFLCLMSLDLLPVESRAEKQDRKTKEVINAVVAKSQKKDNKNKARTQYASWAEHVEPAKWTASKLPDWPRWARVLSGSLLIIILGALVWFLAFR